ncbi:MAG TPA: hypothetical protein PK280_04450 [Planctomycetota bacterium]|nr:hypothetical protein [Planctomycetota bacterium]
MRKFICTLGISLVSSLPVLAGEPGSAPTKVEPELAPDKELMAKIEALPDNTWLKLPPVKTTGDMGVLNKDPDYKRTGPRVRDYCNKMVWAPDRKRALYTGGGHNVHPFNDVWEYDLPSNTWVCLYGADPAPAPGYAKMTPEERVEWWKTNAVLKDGVVRSPRGAPVRPCHTWWSLAYDSDRRQMLFLESHKGLVFQDKGTIAKALGIDPKDPLLNTYGSGPGEAWLFTFDPAKREWGEVLTKVPKSGESCCLEYLPDSKTVWWFSGKVYRLDAAKKEWPAYPAAKPLPNGGETAYDPESRKVVATIGQKTWVFSCDEGSWTLAQENADDGGIVPSSTFCYDSTARKFVLYTHMKVAGQPEGARLRFYDLKENKWSDPKPEGALPKIGNVAGYYDPERNVTVIYNAAETWVYRGKKASKPEGK